MTAAALAVTTPHYQWYALLLVMLVALDGHPEWLAFAAGGYYAAEPSLGHFTVPWHYRYAVGYGIPVLVVTAGWLVRRFLVSPAATPAPVPVPVPVPVPAETVPAEAVTVLEPVGASAAAAAGMSAAMEHTIAAPSLRSILADDKQPPLPHRVRV